MKVKLTSHNSEVQMHWGNNDDTRQYLKVGKWYELLRIEVHTMHTKFTLVGFENHQFNSVNFDNGYIPEIDNHLDERQGRV